MQTSVRVGDGIGHRVRRVFRGNDHVELLLFHVVLREFSRVKRDALCAQNGTTCLRVVYSPYWTTDTLSWASSAPDVAEVDENGIITGKTLGKAVITATCGSLSDTCEITVVAESELPKYSEGEWLLDGKTAYIPLESIGAEHTLYLDIEVDSASLADGQSFGLFGTTTDGNPSFCTMAYMKDSSGHGFLSWATSDCSSDFDSGEKQSLYSSRSVSITEIEGTTVGTKLIFAPDGIYNLNGVRIWETSSQKVSLSTSVESCISMWPLPQTESLQPPHLPVQDQAAHSVCS